MFVKLSVMPVRGKSCVVVVACLFSCWKECVEVLMTFMEGDFMEKAEHCNVASQLWWSEVVVDESVVWREVDGVDESRVESVEWFESGSCCVVDGAGCGFDDWLDVSFVLVDERLRRVHVDCP